MAVWAITPDWANGVLERLEFKTDVFTGWSGAEQRRALRLAPRRFFQFDVQAGDRERRTLEALLFARSSEAWTLPIFPDVQPLAADVAAGAGSIACDTTGRDFVDGGAAILLQEGGAYEVLAIATVGPTTLTLATPTAAAWPAGSLLYPARSARLTRYPQLERANARRVSTQVEFQLVEACDWPEATGLTTYRGLAVLEDAPNEGGSTGQYERHAETIDNGTSLPTVDDTADMGFPGGTHGWWMRGAAARGAFRSLLYLLKGRRGQLWVPTYQADLLLVANVTAVATTIDVEACGYTDNLVGQVGRKDIRIELFDGTVFYRRISAAVKVGADKERLTISSALGQAVTPADVRRISFMAVCRLDSDSIEILHHGMIDGMAEAVTPFRAVKNDV